MSMIDEKAKRRETLDEFSSAPVKLGDGQTYWIPKPYIQLHAVFRDGKAVDDYPILTYGPELDALIQAMSECKDTSALLIGAASLGAYLLCRNYDLTDGELDQLFNFRIGDEDSYAWVKEIMGIATGTSAKKASSGGED